MATWEEGFSHLLDYIREHGDARVPQAYTIDGYRLGAWVNKQHRARSGGKLEVDRQQRLEELPGWIWEPRAGRWEAGRWEEWFSRLLDYVNEHGDACVPPEYTANGYRLGAWTSVQLALQANGRLDADRERRLEGLPGWRWRPRRHSQDP